MQVIERGLFGPLSVADIPFHYAMSHLNAHVHVHHVTLRRASTRGQCKLMSESSNFSKLIRSKIDTRQALGCVEPSRVRGPNLRFSAKLPNAVHTSLGLNPKVT